MDEEKNKSLLSRALSSAGRGWEGVRGNLAGELALGLTPAGYAADFQDIAKGAKDRDALGVALASLGLIPVVGDLAKAGGKAARAGRTARAAETVADAAPPPRRTFTPGKSKAEVDASLQPRAGSELDEISETWSGRDQGFHEQEWYHGTPNPGFEGFNPSEEGLFGPGTYLTDYAPEASEYAGVDNAFAATAGSQGRFAGRGGKEARPGIYQTRTRIENPYVLKAANADNPYKYLEARFGIDWDALSKDEDTMEFFEQFTQGFFDEAMEEADYIENVLGDAGQADQLRDLVDGDDPQGFMRWLDENGHLQEIIDTNFGINSNEQFFNALPKVSGQEMVQRMKAAGYDSIIAEIDLEDVMLGAASDGGMMTTGTRARDPEYRQMLKDAITQRTGQEAPDVVRYLNVFEPEKIRSPQARFDPDKRKSRDLLAALSGVGLGGAAMSQAATNRGMTDGA